MDNRTYWIWYPGDFERYHAMRQNFSRVERGMGWPAFWKSEGFRNRVAFRRTYELAEETSFTVFAKAVGYVLAGDRKYPFGRRIVCGPGTVVVAVHAGCIEQVPSVYVQGEVIHSDGSWTVGDYDRPPVKVGYSKYFTEPTQDPACWEYQEERYLPVRCGEVEGGVLYEFETELTAVLEVRDLAGPRELTLCCGESREEALDPEHCYYSWTPDPETGRCPRCAVRFVYIPGCRAGEVELTAHHQYVDIPVRASFHCDDELLNRIWEVAARTFSLCSGIFFIDGVKRDRWIWGGDAYQSFYVNQYLMADADINRRTLLALRGNDPMTTHINTIVDYTLFWILGVKYHCETYRDREFLEQVWPQMVSLMEFCEGQTDEQGFLVGREGDWIFIDWADLDKEGPLCAEQILYAACFRAMAWAARELGEKSASDKESSCVSAVKAAICGKSDCELAERAAFYEKRGLELMEKVDTCFWDEEQGAYIDSYTSGRRHVTRHANLLAIFFELIDEKRRQTILERVLLNPAVPQITTPYFKFYEMDALCRCGCLDQVLEQIKSYWGGMLERGAVTFWEEFDPDAPVEEQYDMYGDRFGKSLCHAWAASPIYLLGWYFIGLDSLTPGETEHAIRPQTRYFRELDCTLPLSQGCVQVHWDGEKLETRTVRHS